MLGTWDTFNIQHFSIGGRNIYGVWLWWRGNYLNVSQWWRYLCDGRFLRAIHAPVRRQRMLRSTPSWRLPRIRLRQQVGHMMSTQCMYMYSNIHVHVHVPVCSQATTMAKSCVQVHKLEIIWQFALVLFLWNGVWKKNNMKFTVHVHVTSKNLVTTEHSYHHPLCPIKATAEYVQHMNVLQCEPQGSKQHTTCESSLTVLGKGPNINRTAKKRVWRSLKSL